MVTEIGCCIDSGKVWADRSFREEVDGLELDKSQNGSQVHVKCGFLRVLML